MKKDLLPFRWVVLLALSLSLAWLLPNHYPPWVAFHGDVWTVAVLAVLSLWIIARCNRQVKATSLVVFASLITTIPLIQFAFGQIVSFGTAWVCTAYLFAFVLAIQTGQRWEADSPGQCADFVFLTVLVAAGVSTALQLYQVLGPEETGAWVMSIPNRMRPHANIGQPNILASLQLLAVLACSWGHFRGRLPVLLAIPLACFLLMGVALTGSRTAWVNIALLVVLVLIFRKAMTSPRAMWATVGLALFFCVCVFALPSLYAAFGVSADFQVGDSRGFANNARFAIWKMFLEASLQSPMVGFGWGQIGRANFSIVDSAAGNIGLFNSAHNQVLDLVLWCGYPLAIVLLAATARWGYDIVARGVTTEVLHKLLFLSVIGVHAMFEYPMQYAVFLWPLGLMMGALDVPNTTHGWTLVRRGVAIVITAVGIVVAALTARDYLRVESGYKALRFEVRGIQINVPSVPPDLLVLTQFRDYFVLVRNTPRAGLDAHDLQWMRDSVNTLPSPQSLYKLAANLALNAQGAEAQLWLRRLCKTMVAENCEKSRLQWESDGLAESTGVFWPKTGQDATDDVNYHEVQNPDLSKNTARLSAARTSQIEFGKTK